MATQKYSFVREEHDNFLWKTCKFWDTKVIIKDSTLFLHKAILTRCEWFQVWYESHKNESQPYVINLEKYWPRAMKTLLWFIYKGEVHHDLLQPTARPPRIYHLTFAVLFNMGVTFEFPLFQDAVMDLGHKSLQKGLEYAQRHPTAHFPKTQIDDLMSGAKTAYNGDKYKQAALRSLYVSFFFQCYRNVKMDPNFYAALRTAPDFSVDLLEMLGLNDWEWDGICAETASSESSRSSTAISWAMTSGLGTAPSSRSSRSTNTSSTWSSY